ncbi:MAG: YitT family protein [Pseudobutyrivibrio sp.]|uniref:YitT family protein n=1 Tax=Pseudobutyrivibrio sp. TaxID=2014367 RepID=UPI0025F79C57|nr:YitT family protein [Pseudobutyrivibrio sp.]MBQ6461804.1 YitT family protein [Pseudobutyrivibrio sp.]
MIHKIYRHKQDIYEYLMFTIASAVMVIGIYFFKFPNHFSFGGVSGLSIVLAALLPHTPGYINLVINIVLLILGFITFGKSFGIKTTYITLLVSFGPSILEKLAPMDGPLTTQPVLELMFAIALPAFASAVFFNLGASSGGTDIVAMILKKYTKVDIGTALFMSDVIIVILACLVFNVETGLFSLVGLLAKSLVVDETIENINLAKYFTIICTNPEPIVDYIMNDLGKGATVYKAEGAYGHTEKTVILTILKRQQAVELKNFIRRNQPGAFIAITNSSEIIGKGFRGYN